MFCSGCGQALAMGQPVCPRCGRPVVPGAPPVPGIEFQLESYSGKVRALSVAWFVYAVLSLLLGLAGLSFAHVFFSNHFGPWGHGSWNDMTEPPVWLGPAVFHLVWVTLLFRAALALAAAWGLYTQSRRGRIVAIVAAILSLLRFPLGTALGIWTLVTLLGYRNRSLYEQVSWDPRRGIRR